MSYNNNSIEGAERFIQCCSVASPIYAHNNKRQHDNLESSQEGRNVMTKKTRFQGLPLSPGDVSSATSCSNKRELALNEDRQQYRIRWWMTKPPLAVEASSIHCTTLLCCFVCNQRLSSPLDVVEYKVNESNKQSTNLLLNYFSARRPTSILSSNTTVPVQEYRHQFHSFCSFCDRQSCATCSRICQKCEQRFCTLCTTTDYTCTMERIFCLDCARSTCDDDAMTIE